MAIYFNTYKPLCSTLEGQRAIEVFNYPRFVDNSIRREPDFQHEYPSISAICRANNFAPRLQKGDIIVYTTVKGKYLGIEEAHWRTVAVLKVLERMLNHEKAAEWYIEKGLRLPSNCIVSGNDPLPKDHSAGNCGTDESYKARVAENPVFHICEKLYCELSLPNPLFKKDMITAMGSVPSTQTPPSISKQQFINLLEVARIKDKIDLFKVD